MLKVYSASAILVFWAITVNAQSLSQDQAEKYVYAKYQEAVKEFDAQHYDRALEMAQALLKLEPNSRYREYLDALIKNADQKVFERYLLQASIVQKERKEYYRAGETITLTLQLQNNAAGTLKIEPGKSPQGKAYLVVDRKVESLDTQGNTQLQQTNDLIEMDTEIALASGKTWSKTFRLEPPKSESSAPFRQIRVGAKILLTKISGEGVNQFRDVFFEPVTLKIYPKDWKVPGDRLPSLQKALEANSALDLFLTATTLKENEKENACGRLVEALQKDNPPLQKTIVACLRYLTGREDISSDPAAWLDWWKERKQKK